MTPDERLPAVPDVDKTDRDIHYGGKVYKWPSRVAIVGYGLKAGIPPRVHRLVRFQSAVLRLGGSLESRDAHEDTLTCDNCEISNSTLN